MAKNRNEDEEKGKMTVEEAGRKGGEKTSETHDSDFYSDIGRKGGHSSGSGIRDEDQEEEEEM